MAPRKITAVEPAALWQGPRRPTKRAPRPPRPAASAPPRPRHQGRSVATRTQQQGQEVPRFFFSDAPWKAQRQVRRDLPLGRVPWPPRGCTISVVDVMAGGAQLLLPAGVTFCATCSVAVHFRSHYHGDLHVARTKAAVEKEAKTKRAAGAPAPPGQRSDANLATLCRRRLGEDPQFTALLTGPLTPPPPTSGRPPTAEDRDGVGTMDVERLLEL
ncbi:hypothetical protein HPB52_000820 [Rhipicephalus sanguineus]|uniref:Uncharacterized protein n=1 Tax=Rhipicephalus sanguineus TaxID=34632 RepID=A0A9D4PW11_RHISA|nr:hypothetical protein HPB52_000820 [Rhipicephalus sanguineus]